MGKDFGEIGLGLRPSSQLQRFAISLCREVLEVRNDGGLSSASFLFACCPNSVHEIGQALSVVALQEFLERLRLDIEAIVDESAQICRPVDAVQIQPQSVPAEHVLGFTFESAVDVDLKILVRAFDLQVQLLAVYFVVNLDELFRGNAVSEYWTMLA